MELLDYALIGVCAVISLYMVCCQFAKKLWILGFPEHPAKTDLAQVDLTFLGIHVSLSKGTTARIVALPFRV